MIHISRDQLDQIIDDASQKATVSAFEYMMCIPLMVLHDHIGEIRLKEYDGVCREEHFFDLCIDLYESFTMNYVKLTDMAKEIKDATGFDVASRFRYKKGFTI